MIKILFLAANPSEGTRLRLDQESRAIDQALRQAEFRDQFDLQQHWAVRVADLQALLLRHQPHIVHFSGHGSVTSEIILEDDKGHSHPVAISALRQLFSVLKDNIRCVVLNACFSKPQAEAIAQHIDCVIGMSQAIQDTAAVRFAASFYQALGFGRDLKTAFELGCLQIDLENIDEADIPQLLAPNHNPAELFFVAKQETLSAKVEAMSQNQASAGKPKGSGGVTIGNVSGGITGSIIAGRDVSGATITVGGQPTPADKTPTFDEFRQLLAEIQQQLTEVTASQEGLQAVSPAAPFTAQGAAQSIQDAAHQIEPAMNPEKAQSVQQRLADAIKLLGTILDGAKTVAQKAGEAAKAVQPLVEKLEPLVEKISVAVLWGAKLWL
ncbi:MAG TPA: CHAT domain-containing protein [Caldilineaceae bacterium]|nr:CHAT domain-containing protein [Caldilineaceae bacterium]